MLVRHSCHFVHLEVGLLAQVEKKWKRGGTRGVAVEGVCVGGWAVFFGVEVCARWMDVAFAVGGRTTAGPL